ncbi:MAG: hypothetical protein IAG10_00270 [Planctomycetaceae bacterium]|nr:hypothetical protein [Planctomycetaceae bacterium]
MGLIQRLFGKQKPKEPAEYQSLLEQSMEELRLKTAAHDGLWHLSDAKNWSVDQDVGQIVFSLPKGMKAICDVQIIGTYNTDDETWLWGWDHPAVQKPLQDHAWMVKRYGDSHAISRLTTKKLACTEDEAWEFTALACKLAEAQGAYRGPSGPTLVFMTFGQPSLEKSDDKSSDEMDSSSSAASRMDNREFSELIPDDVAQTVSGFIKALHDWEVEAYALGKKGDRDTPRSRYKTLIREWCCPEVVPQPCSYGSDPSHHPERERLIAVCVETNGCIVKTKHTNANGFTSDHEYHLKRDGDRWLIENLMYVDDEGSYPSL